MTNQMLPQTGAGLRNGFSDGSCPSLSAFLGDALVRSICFRNKISHKMELSASKRQEIATKLLKISLSLAISGLAVYNIDKYIG